MVEIGKCYVRGCENWIKERIIMGNGEEFVFCDNHADKATEILRKANDRIKKITRETADILRGLK